MVNVIGSLLLLLEYGSGRLDIFVFEVLVVYMGNDKLCSAHRKQKQLCLTFGQYPRRGDLKKGMGETMR